MRIPTLDRTGIVTSAGASRYAVCSLAMLVQDGFLQLAQGIQNMIPCAKNPGDPGACGLMRS